MNKYINQKNIINGNLGLLLKIQMEILKQNIMMMSEIKVNNYTEKYNLLFFS